LYSSAFSLTLDLPPRYTLFPYTTLFRSPKPYTKDTTAKYRGVFLNTMKKVGSKSQIRLRRERHRDDCPFAQRRLNSSGLQHSVPDRKSTRLNSSHVSISYAVFCLKNKMT